MEDDRMKDHFAFDSYSGDSCSGNFTIDPEILRHAFSSINEQALGLYGLRSIERTGQIVDVGLFDPRRAAFEELCQKFGHRQAELVDFKSLIRVGSGLIANSLQSPRQSKHSGFNSLAYEFIRTQNFIPGHFPELIEVVIFMGSYDRGFGMHRDISDVTSFVLDGRKHIAVRADDGVDRIWTVAKGQYVRWRSRHWHGSRNPGHEWSVTANFGVLPDVLTHDVPVGTPVPYVHSETRLKDHVAYLEDRARRKKREEVS